MALEQELLGTELAKKLQAEKDAADAAALAASQVKTNQEVKKTTAAKKNIILKNTLGESVEQKDYFFSVKGVDAAPHYFADVCGYPVDREDMLTVFNKIFKPKDGILFYKTKDKEVYIIIVPIKHSSTIGPEHNSIEGDFQKHAISFITEGSVNLDTLRMKLEKVAKHIKIVAE